jgi:hypothetical protein
MSILKGFGNGLVDITKGFLKGAGAGIPGSEEFINKIIEKLPRFQTGGQFIVPPQYRNDSFLMRASAGERITVEPTSQTYNNSTTNIYGLSSRRNFTADVFL